MTRKWHLASGILLCGCVLWGLARKGQFVIWKMAPLVAKGPAASAAAAGSEKEERHLLRQGLRSPCFRPRRDPAWRAVTAARISSRGRLLAHLAHCCGHFKPPNRHYIMALGWINRLLYPFCEIQLSGKNKYTAMGYPHRLHFHVINAFNHLN